jgi:hypothetical protein
MTATQPLLTGRSTVKGSWPARAAIVIGPASNRYWLAFGREFRSFQAKCA